MSYTIRPLDASTWDAFAELVERNNGIFGGCWCIGYHPECGQRGISHRSAKEDRVRTGGAHAAPVLHESRAAQGWGQRQVGKHAWVASRAGGPARPYRR